MEIKDKLAELVSLREQLGQGYHFHIAEAKKLEVQIVKVNGKIEFIEENYGDQLKHTDNDTQQDV